MSEGVETIATLGGRVARVTISPRYYSDYNITPTCYSDFSLRAAAEIPDVRRAFDTPGIDTFIITAYDGTSFGDCQRKRFLDTAFYTPANTEALMKEYSDFTLYLYQRFRQTHKRFIISNWEADNTIYCGQAYSFATCRDMEASCRENYLRTYEVASPEAALEGLKLWLQVRADGILDGRRRALKEGIGGMRVYYAPEFNIVRVLREHGLKSVLYDVIPSVMFDYVSYSAYESINAPDPAASLTSDLDLIRQVAGSNAIIVGETGFSRRDWHGDEVRRTAAVIDAALEWGVPYLIQWCLFDSGPSNPYGLYDIEGEPTSLAVWFQERFLSPAPLRKFCREAD